jgi:hypothetical protein
MTLYPEDKCSICKKPMIQQTVKNDGAFLRCEICGGFICADCRHLVDDAPKQTPCCIARAQS